MRILLAILSLLAAACSVPDDPNWDALQSGIRGLPPGVMVDAKRWVANRNAAEWLTSRPGDNVILRVECGDGSVAGPTPPPTLATYKITVSDVLRCLDMTSGADTGNVIFIECVWRLFQEREAQFTRDTGLSAECLYETVGELKATPMPADWEPKNVKSPDDISRRLVESPTLPKWVPWTVGGIAAGILFAPVFFPALCALRADAGRPCPGDPSYPPGQTPQPDQGSP